MILKYLKIKYRFENNFVELSKLLCRTFKCNDWCCKKFSHSSNQFERFCWGI